MRIPNDDQPQEHQEHRQHEKQEEQEEQGEEQQQETAPSQPSSPAPSPSPSAEKNTPANSALTPQSAGASLPIIFSNQLPNLSSSAPTTSLDVEIAALESKKADVEKELNAIETRLAALKLQKQPRDPSPDASPISAPEISREKLLDRLQQTQAKLETPTPDFSPLSDVELAHQCRKRFTKHRVAGVEMVVELYQLHRNRKPTVQELHQLGLQAGLRDREHIAFAQRLHQPF